MNKFKLFSLLIGTLAVGVIIGTYAGALWAGRAFGRMQFARPGMDLAFRSAQEANWAALIRLNQASNALSDLENMVNINLATIAGWDLVAPPDEQTRKARNNLLISAKTYLESFPASGRDSDRINGLLGTVPNRNPQNTCKNGVCQLDDLRLAKLHATTNSP
jgi:hypothetical protein